MRIMLVGAALMLAPAIAVAQPRTITITTTTTVTLPPDAAVSDLPPGETAPNAQTTAGTAAEPAPAPRWRFTAAAGLGTTDDPGPMIDVRIGRRLTRRLMITAGLTLLAADDLYHAETLTLQFRPVRRFWLEAGAGAGIMDRHQEGMLAALTAALGYDVYASRGFAVNAQLRSVVSEGGGVGLLVGASWL